ncbi:MAG: AraC family transcriptional regulator [Cyanobacteria bacterium P01_G01_bin.54]
MKPIQLTDTDWDSIFEQAKAGGQQLDQAIPGGMQLNIPDWLGAGGDRIIDLRGGLTIFTRHAQLKRPIRYVIEHDAQFPLVAKFYLSGSSRVQTPHATDCQRDYQEVKHCHYLYHLPNQMEIEEWPAHEPIHVVMVYVDPQYFETFDWGDRCPTVSTLQTLLAGDRTQRFHQSLGRITPQIQQVLQHIIHCPYQGMMQQLYLESKALELFTLQFAAWADVGPTKRSTPLRSHDIQQLHAAREILIQQIEQPPSLSELSRRVGLNDRKLKQGFRQLFGTTVFGYLQNHRMEQAKVLLRDADFSIAQVAFRVGYTNPEAFSTAFRRQFAISPKAYQLGRRN